MNRKRVLVIGAGPMGLFAAYRAAEKGFDVTVLEKDRVGSSLRRWGSVRCFTPLDMNAPASVLARNDLGLPPGEELLTGPEMVERVLEPLSRAEPLAGRVHAGHAVVRVARAGVLRTDFPGHPIRSEKPFLVLCDGEGGERYFEGEVVLDASGVYGQPAWMGPGGLPAIGERACAGRIVRHLGDLEDRGRFALKRTLVVGNGHSAAHAVLILDHIARSHPGTTIVWAVRSPNRRPCEEVAGDPLPERSRVAGAANALAASPPSHLIVERRAVVQSLVREGTGVRVHLSGGRRHAVDTVASFTGYRPDQSLSSELAVEVSPTTEGAARLTKALSHVSDCLSVPNVRCEDLESGEPGFFLVGSKSYGRSKTFLLRTGLDHVETILEMAA